MATHTLVVDVVTSPGWLVLETATLALTRFSGCSLAPGKLALDHTIAVHVRLRPCPAGHGPPSAYKRTCDSIDCLAFHGALLKARLLRPGIAARSDASHETGEPRICSCVALATRADAGNCSTVACWPSHRRVTSTICPSGNSRAS
jgi:hypothetical protein